MTNKTPPAWAINAATELEGRGNILDIGVISRTIAAHAPDADALALALETIDAELKEYNDGECVCDHSVGICYCAYNSIREQMGSTLSAYRARFPLAPVVVENAPAAELVAK